MKNHYRVEGSFAFIGLSRGHEAVVDVRALSALLGIACSWYANPARKSTTKFYATSKVYNRDTKVAKVTLMHRVIMGDPRDESGRAVDVHHKDNNGLNNRLSNLEALSHKQNCRERTQDADWEAYDNNLDRIAKFKRLVEIGNVFQGQRGLTRQCMWKIRSGATWRSQAARDYWQLVRQEMPEIKGPDDFKLLAAKKISGQSMYGNGRHVVR